MPSFEFTLNALVPHYDPQFVSLANAAHYAKRKKVMLKNSDAQQKFFFFPSTSRWAAALQPTTAAATANCYSLTTCSVFYYNPVKMTICSNVPTYALFSIGFAHSFA